MDPNYLLDRFGAELFWISLLIVFVECGLFFPILPGDTLLFALGLFIVTGAARPLPRPAVRGAVDRDGGPDRRPRSSATSWATRSAASSGQPLYERDGRIIKRKYFDQTTAFFDRHGNKALVIGRFVPFVRTYITVVAGRDADGPGAASSSGASSAPCCGSCRSACSATSSATRSRPSARASTSSSSSSWPSRSSRSSSSGVRHRRTSAPGAEIGPHDGGPDRDITGRDLD